MEIFLAIFLIVFVLFVMNMRRYILITKELLPLVADSKIGFDLGLHDSNLFSLLSNAKYNRLLFDEEDTGSSSSYKHLLLAAKTTYKRSIYCFLFLCILFVLAVFFTV